MHVPPFINHLKITLKVQSLLKQKSNHYLVQFVTAAVKGFRLVREMPECTIDFSK